MKFHVNYSSISPGRGRVEATQPREAAQRGVSDKLHKLICFGRDLSGDTVDTLLAKLQIWKLLPEKITLSFLKNPQVWMEVKGKRSRFGFHQPVRTEFRLVCSWPPSMIRRLVSAHVMHQY